jgi:hypothetical protein
LSSGSAADVVENSKKSWDDRMKSGSATTSRFVVGAAGTATGVGGNGDVSGARDGSCAVTAGPEPPRGVPKPARSLLPPRTVVSIAVCGVA